MRCIYELMGQYLESGNPFGQLGLGNSSSVDYLTPIPNLNGAVHISLGFDHASFIKSDGTLWSVGRNHYGQLGIGSTDNKLVPTEVSGVDNAYVVSSGDYPSLKMMGLYGAWVGITMGNLEMVRQPKRQVLFKFQMPVM